MADLKQEKALSAYSLSWKKVFAEFFSVLALSNLTIIFFFLVTKGFTFETVRNAIFLIVLGGIIPATNYTVVHPLLAVMLLLLIIYLTFTKVANARFRILILGFMWEFYGLMCISTTQLV